MPVHADTAEPRGSETRSIDDPVRAAPDAAFLPDSRPVAVAQRALRARLDQSPRVARLDAVNTTINRRAAPRSGGDAPVQRLVRWNGFNYDAGGASRLRRALESAGVAADRVATMVNQAGLAGTYVYDGLKNPVLRAAPALNAAPVAAPPNAAPVVAPPNAAPVVAPPIAAPVAAPPNAAPVVAPPNAAPVVAPPNAAPVVALPNAAPAVAPPNAAPVVAPPNVAPVVAPPAVVAPALTPPVARPAPNANMFPGDAVRSAAYVQDYNARTAHVTGLPNAPAPAGAGLPGVAVGRRLYHATTRDTAKLIRNTGLQPKRSQWGGASASKDGYLSMSLTMAGADAMGAAGRAVLLRITLDANDVVAGKWKQASATEVITTETFLPARLTWRWKVLQHGEQNIFRPMATFTNAVAAAGRI